MKIAIATAALAALGLAACNTVQEDSASVEGKASTASATSEQNDTTDNGGAVATTPGGVGASGLSTGASGGPGTPTPNNSNPPAPGNTGSAVDQRR